MELVDQLVVTTTEDIISFQKKVENAGGEGVMLRRPGTYYKPGRGKDLLKLKKFYDAEGVVIGHIPGKLSGSIQLQLPGNKSVRCGLGGRQPPSFGTVVQFRYQELTSNGIPRFPTFAGFRHDMSAEEALKQVLCGPKQKPRSTEPRVKPTRKPLEFVKEEEEMFEKGVPYPEVTSKATVKYASPNLLLYDVLKQMADARFDRGEKWKGIAYINAANRIHAHRKTILSVAQAEKEIEKIGGSLSHSIDQILRKGFIEDKDGAVYHPRGGVEPLSETVILRREEAAKKRALDKKV